MFSPVHTSNRQIKPTFIHNIIYIFFLVMKNEKTWETVGISAFYIFLVVCDHLLDIVEWKKINFVDLVFI